LKSFKMADNGSRRSSSPRRDKSPKSPKEDERRKSSSSESNKGNTLYVSGLSLKTTQIDLEAKFSKCGHVENCSLITDPRTKESRGFAFIRMENVEKAEEAIRQLDRSELDGRTLSVEKAK